MARRRARAGGDEIDSGRPRQAGQRQLRVGEELRHVLAPVLLRGEFRDPSLSGANITVSEVRVSPDLRNATVFVMPLGGSNAEEILAGLRRSAPYLRGLIARDVPLRTVPSLAFMLDIAFDQAQRIAAVLASPPVERDLAAEADENGPDEHDTGADEQ